MVYAKETLRVLNFTQSYSGNEVQTAGSDAFWEKPIYVINTALKMVTLV